MVNIPNTTKVVILSGVDAPPGGASTKSKDPLRPKNDTDTGRRSHDTPACAVQIPCVAVDSLDHKGFFDCVGRSLRDGPTPLRMTVCCLDSFRVVLAAARARCDAILLTTDR